MSMSNEAKEQIEAIERQELEVAEAKRLDKLSRAKLRKLKVVLLYILFEVRLGDVVISNGEHIEVTGIYHWPDYNVRPRLSGKLIDGNFKETATGKYWRRVQ